MKHSTLEVLCCPACQCELTLVDQSDGVRTREGELHCAHCARTYSIQNDIARFIDPWELEGPNRRTARFYNRFSRLETVAEWLSFLAIGGVRRARAEILHRLEPGSGPILEVSVGSGGNLPYLFESPGVDSVFGLDISLGQLARCRLTSGRGWPVELFLGMAERLPFKTGSLSSVFHIGGINFFSDRKTAIEEMIRVARPGTKILIADESEHVARLAARLLGLPRLTEGHRADFSPPAALVPDAMREMRLGRI